MLLKPIGDRSPNSLTVSKKGTAKVILFANTDWYLYNFRLSLALTLKQLGTEVVLVSPAGDYHERFALLGLRWRSLTFTRRSLNPIDQVRAVAGLARIYAEEKPDGVHHFTIKPAVYGSLAARLTRVPTIVNSIAGLGSAAGQNSTSEHGVARRLAFASLRLALQNTHVIVQNPDDRDFLSRQNIVAASRCQLIKGSGVD